MFTATASVEIARPAEAVFAYLVDPTTWPRWIAEVKRVDAPSPMKAGDRFEEVTLFRGEDRRCRGEVVEARPPSLFVLRLTQVMSGPDVRPTRRFELTARGAGTRVVWTNDVEVHGVLRLASPVLPTFFRKKMGEYLEALRREIERS